MSHNAARLARLYGWLLRLYPRAFRAEFADEMLDVFRQAVQDAARIGAAPAAMVLLRELADFPFNLLLEHLRERGKTMRPNRDAARDIYIARWIARASSLALTMTFAVVIAINPQPILFSATIGVMTIALAVAWRWEKVGGLLTLGAALVCAVLVGLNAVISVPNLGIVMSIVWGAACILAVLLVWFLPYELLGWLFISIGRSGDRPAQPPVPANLAGLKNG
jgi:hypothetical protein